VSIHATAETPKIARPPITHGDVAAAMAKRPAGTLHPVLGERHTVLQHQLGNRGERDGDQKHGKAGEAHGRSFPW